MLQPCIIEFDRAQHIVGDCYADLFFQPAFAFDVEVDTEGQHAQIKLEEFFVVICFVID